MDDDSETRLRQKLSFLELPAGPIPGEWLDVLRQVAGRVGELEARKEYFRLLTDSGRVLIWVSGSDGGVDHFNKPWLAFTGRTLEQERGDGWLEGVHPEDREACLGGYREAFAAREPFTLEYRLRRADGEYRWILDEGSPRHDTGGVFLGYVGFCYDITERREAEDELRRSLRETRILHEALDRVPSCVYTKDRQSRYTYANRATLDLFGCSAEALQGQGDDAFFPPETVAWLRKLDLRVLGGESTEEEVVVRDPIRGHRVYWEVKAPIHHDLDDPEPDGLLGISTDITAQKEYTQRMEHLAHYDALTGLPNRALLLDRLSKALAQVRRRELWLAVVFLDLDGFKAINDRHGHQMGDRFLHHLARRMGARLREGDTLARLGGDEFVVILVDLVGPEAVDPLLQRVLRAVSEPVHEDGHDLCVTASLGVTLTRGEPGVTPDRLLQEADQAMYRAKEAGRNRYHLSGSPPDSAPGSRP